MPASNRNVKALYKMPKKVDHFHPWLIKRVSQKDTTSFILAEHIRGWFKHLNLFDANNDLLSWRSGAVPWLQQHRLRCQLSPRGRFIAPIAENSKAANEKVQSQLNLSSEECRVVGGDLAICWDLTTGMFLGLNFFHVRLRRLTGD